MIELKHLQKIYDQSGAARTHAVNDVSLQLPDRGMVAIFGRSGCGKTTLLNCIGGLDRVTSGEALLNGEPITPSACDARNRYVGYIFQNYNLSLKLSVYENVALSLRLCGMKDEREIERRVLAALTSVDMLKYRKRLPDTLSGGQQQRVAIARAIVKDPAVILADEPTGNLDEQNTVLVMDLLREISKKHLVLLVTHEAELVDLYCERVIEMGDGRVLGDRENAVTAGFTGKNAQDIYLGDLPCEAADAVGISLEYFGGEAGKPTALRLVAVGDTLYVKADTPLKLRVLDQNTEARVHEGKYEERAPRTARELSPVLSEALPLGETGRMYGLGGAIKSGFRANFTKVRRGKKMLIAALVCFPIIIALILAIFGTTFYRLQTVDTTYNHNVVFVKTSAFSPALAQEYLAQGTVDHVAATRYGYTNTHPNVLSSFFFCIGNFETFGEDYSSFFSAEGLMLPASALAAEQRLLCGTGAPLREDQILISRGYADLLLQQVGVDFIEDYEDLLYTVGRYDNWRSDANALCVIGITDEQEPVLYLHDYVYAQNMIGTLYSCNAGYVTDLAHSGLALPSLSRGEIYCTADALVSDGFAAGDRVTLGGLTLTIKELLEYEWDHEEFTRWVIERYGEDIFKNTSCFSRWFYGPDYTVYDEWLAHTGGTGDYDEALLDLEKQYNTTYAEVKAEYARSISKNMPGIVMHEQDLMTLTYAVGEGIDTQNTFALLNTSWVKYEGGYYALHTEQPEALAAALIERFGATSVTTPEEMREFQLSYLKEELTVAAVVILVLILIMSMCLYFIMRSSLMGDIKEVGILRAIGVSRRNLTFRYFVETMVLFALTVLPGFLLSSAGLLALSSMHESMSALLYYPWWMALGGFAGLLGVCTLCGLAPILSLLRRSPAEILSKYDI